MTKQYIGNDEYKVFLSSGVELTLSESDIQELSEDKVSRNDFNEVCEAADEISDELNDFGDILSGLRDTIKADNATEYSGMTNIMETIANVLWRVKHIKTNIEMRS